jgi:hypothetical protein
MGMTHASPGSLSESVATFDPGPLKEIAVGLGHTIRSRPNHRFDATPTDAKGEADERNFGRGCPCPRAGCGSKRSHGWRSAADMQ